MRWVRDKVRHGSWLALFALVVNFALSFGHIHVAGHNPAEGLIVAVIGLSDHDKAPAHPSGHADDLCPICIATSAIANGLASVPPAIAVQLTATVIDRRPVEPVRLVLVLPRAPFQSRAPPMS
jgi:hypothetical protein